MNIIFLGPPGSGKGTHAQKVSQAMGVPHLSTGNMLRENIKSETALGLEAEAFIEAGKLVPDELVIEMLKARLQEPDCANGAIFDGFPRTVRQAEALGTIITVDRVLNLDIEDAEIVKRMSGRRVCPVCGYTSHINWLGDSLACPRCGNLMATREDDAPETVLERLRVYHAETKPLVNYYQEKGVLKTVDALGDIEEVEKNVREALQ